MIQKFWHDRNTDTLNFEYRVVINMKSYVATQAISAMDHRYGGVPLEHVWTRMRRDLMHRIEQALFKE